MRTISEILQSTSDTLFPAEMGEKLVTLGSRSCEGDSPLHVMAWRDDIDGVQALIDAGALVDAVGDMGTTPLYVAVSKASNQLAEILLRAGADPNIRSEFGNTPWELADKKGGSMARLFK